MPFVKGKSGNPGGRPAIPDELKKAFAELAPEAVKTLAEILRDPLAKHSDRINAAEVVLDRHLGKAVQAVNVEGEGVNVLIMAPGQFKTPEEWENQTTDGS